MARHILQPRDGVMFSGVPADVAQKSTDSSNFGKTLEFSQYNCVSYQAWWSGLDSFGMFKIQTSIKPEPLETDWVDKVGSEIKTTIGVDGTDIRVISNIGEKSVRVIWVPESDNTTGTVSAELMGKDSSGPSNFTRDVPLEVTASFTGLRRGGKITEVELSSTEWRALPATPLTARNAISIQNLSAINIKINYDKDELNYFGVQILAGVERFYDVTEYIIIYAKSQSGNPKIIIEELS